MLGKQPSLTRSKQLYHLNFDGGNCELAKPDSGLDPYIDYFWLLTIEKPSLALEVIPDAAIDIVLSPDMPNFTALYFPTAEKFNINLEGPIQYAGICCHSDTAPELFGLDLAVLRGLEMGAETSETLGLTPLMADIQRVNTITSIAKRFDRFWLDQLSHINNTHPKNLKNKIARISHQDMINVVEGTIGSGSIASICNAIGISERQFRRLSNDLFGLSPKKLQRVLRLQAALAELLQSDAMQLKDLYYDDSHRIKELKHLTGYTPNQIRKMAENYNNL